MLTPEPTLDQTALATISVTPPTTAVGAVTVAPTARELGGRDGPEPTRFGDWERAGRCVDF